MAWRESSSANLSQGEKTFILHGVEENVRNDGRSRTDYQSVELETGIISGAYGSARVRLANTEILVGVKGDLASPAISNPNIGCLEFFVDISANAGPAFEGRGGERLADNLCSAIKDSYCNKRALDLTQLKIIAGKSCWLLNIDILVLEIGGNLFDTMALAVKAALYNTHLPSLKVVVDDLAEPEVQISDNPYECDRINVDHAPVMVTLNKIGEYFVVDSSMEEQACSLCKFVTSISDDGSIMLQRKVGPGSLFEDSIVKMIQTARDIGIDLNRALLDKLTEEETRGERTKTGFLR